MTSVTGRYIFALPTIDLISEKLEELYREAGKSGTEPVIRAIHGRVSSRGSLSVSREIADVVEEYSSIPHVILIVTHEGMMATDLTCAAAAPWHMRADEVPSATIAGEFRIPSASRFFEAAYDLAPVEETEWYRVSLSRDAPTVA